MKRLCIQTALITALPRFYDLSLLRRRDVNPPSERPDLHFLLLVRLLRWRGGSARRCSRRRVLDVIDAHLTCFSLAGGHAPSVQGS